VLQFAPVVRGLLDPPAPKAYCLSPAAQFTTTAIGIVGLAVLEGECGIRKRCPSAETAYV
jgi:hypothetical protein